MSKYPCIICPYSGTSYVCEQSTCEKYKAYKAMSLYEEVGEIAKQTVIRTMMEGEKEHGDEWLYKSINYHKEHALGHAELNYVGDKSDKHTNNGLTRNAMILYMEANKPERK